MDTLDRQHSTHTIMAYSQIITQVDKCFFSSVPNLFAPSTTRNCLASSLSILPLAVWPQPCPQLQEKNKTRKVCSCECRCLPGFVAQPVVKDRRSEGSSAAQFIVIALLLRYDHAQYQHRNSQKVRYGPWTVNCYRPYQPKRCTYLSSLRILGSPIALKI